MACKREIRHNTDKTNPHDRPNIQLQFDWPQRKNRLATKVTTDWCGDPLATETNTETNVSPHHTNDIFISHQTNTSFCTFPSSGIRIGAEVAFGPHYMLAIPTIERLGTDEQRDKWLPLCRSLKLIGSYVQTEVGHGQF